MIRCRLLTVFWLFFTAWSSSLQAQVAGLQGDPMGPIPSLQVQVRASETAEFCSPAPGTLCLGRDRFGVEIEWTDFAGTSGPATALPFLSDDSGLFWFFDSNNWEVLVKVLQGCELNGHFWVFAAATTDVAYVLRVTDHVAGVVKEYSNPLGVAAPAITDTEAFPTCQVVGGRPDLLLFANPTSVPVQGSSVVTAIVRDAAGNLAGPGTRIHLEASLGTVEGEISTDVGGQAEAIFTAGDQPGRAMVTASVDGADQVSVELTVLETPSAELFLVANPSILTVLDATEITVVARDADGIALGAGRSIRLLADLGSIEHEVVTDERGEAVALFTAGDRPGIGSVTAFAGGSPPAQVDLEIRDAPAGLFSRVSVRSWNVSGSNRSDSTSPSSTPWESPFPTRSSGCPASGVASSSVRLSPIGEAQRSPFSSSNPLT